MVVYFKQFTQQGKICGDGHLHANLFAQNVLNVNLALRGKHRKQLQNAIKNGDKGKIVRRNRGIGCEKRDKKLRVPVLPVEEMAIKSKAQESGLTVAEYLRNLGLGYHVPSVIDNRHVDALLKINADLGRLGGLIKLWLTNDKRTRLIGKSQLHMTLDSIRETQNVMLNEIMKLKK
ncbi:plasmid mobilization protein [Nitrosomonas aestuarii]|uniref:plasmid mobilization protein n=1 Tax=Nitrosomonas aestuarii TaxID=52441 RepID=UPI000D441CAA|nr:hypothetical protein [Nitrosomonas aestuarii]PTN12449.1 hypothetical protein C8R11_10312 [Nitrosomonas aestuarii]